MSEELTSREFLLYKGRDQAMDTHTRILRWERAIQENPAIIVLAIIVLLTVIFIGVLSH